MIGRRTCFLLGWALMGAVLCASIAWAGEIKDSESATHGHEAALVTPIETYKFPGFEIVQFELAVLSQFSYLVVSNGQALVVDPIRDVQAYLDYAAQNKLKIIGVWLTHNNADFVAGHTELAAELGCPVHIGSKAGAGFKFEPLNEGSIIEVGKARIKVIETPGHTPESTSGVVATAEKPETPLALISGDTLFVGSVGRPDLMGGQVAAASLASMMYDSWTKKLAPLPDEVVVLPAHGAGSLCGAHLSDEPSSTIGAQRATNVYLQYKTRAEFIAAILDGLPQAPQYFRHNAGMNKKGPVKVDWSAEPELFTAPTTDLADPSKYYVLDLREAKEYAAGHIPGSVNIGLRGRLETWAGIMVPWESELVLCGSLAEIKEALPRLHRVGYTAKAIVYEEWVKAGHPATKNVMITPAELYSRMQAGTAPVVVDVRLPKEWMGLRIGTVLNLPLNELARESAKLEPDKEVVAVCNSAYRSSMAVGILERNGFTKASSLDGGSQAWIEAGYPTFSNPGPGKTTASAAPGRTLNLPDRLSPQELKRMILDIPGAFQLIDIRPPASFADYNLPGSVNVDIGEAMSSPAYLIGHGPLIIVDRDGSLAMAVAGIISQKTKRPVKALHGGLEAYWRINELGPVVRPVTIPGSGGPAPKTSPLIKPAPAGPQPPAATPEKPKKPKRRSAGC